MFSVFEFSGPRAIDAAGRVFCYSTATYASTGADPRLTVYADGTAVGVLLPGGVIELPESPRQWQVVPVVNTPLLTGTVQVGEGRMQSGTINGTVSVVDGEVQRVVQGWQGLAMMNRQGGASSYAAVGMCIYNPALTGVVRSLSVDGTGGTMLSLWTANVSAEPLFVSRHRVRNKMANLSSGSYQITDGCSYSFLDSTVPGSQTPDIDNSKFSNWQSWGAFRISGNTATEVIRQGPIVIPAGYAIVIVSNSFNTAIYARADVEGMLT